MPHEGYGAPPGALGAKGQNDPLLVSPTILNFGKTSVSITFDVLSHGVVGFSALGPGAEINLVADIP